MAKSKRSKAEHEQLLQTVQMFEVIAETEPNDVQSLEILKEAYLNLDRDSDAVGVSKKIAQAYVRLGQLSSAILEYEGILQKFPDEVDCVAALKELEEKMAGLAGGGSAEDGKTAASAAAQTFADARRFKDSNEALVKFFQEHQLLNEKDAANVLSAIISAISESPSNKPAPSLIALLEERGIASADKSLCLIAEKTRLPFIPLALYDIDVAKTSLLEKDFSLRHLVLPFDQISKTFLVATVNPFDAQAKSHVESKIKGRVQWYLTSPLDLTKQLKDVYHI